MKKSDIIAKVASEAGITNEQAGKAMNALLEVIRENVVNGENVSFPGFGTFSATERGEREYMNPQTKEKILSPAHKVVKFKASKNNWF